MAVRDPETEWIRVRSYRRMTGEQRLAIAAEMFEDGITIVKASILDKSPGISDEELTRRIRRRVLPRDLAKEVEAHLRKRAAA